MNHRTQITALSAAASNVHALSADLPEADAASGSWMMIMPSGTIKARDGRGPWTAGGVTEMQAIVDRTLARAARTELMVDYDHQGHWATAPGAGGRADAAGWVKQFEVRADGIWARIEWTEAASAKIKGRVYRYLSPLFTDNKKTGQIDTIINIGLVNQPAIDLEAIAARATTETDMKKIIALLKLNDASTEDDIVASVTALMASTAVIAAAAGLGADADAVAVKAAVEVLSVKAKGVEAVALAAGVAKDADTSVIAAAVTAGLSKTGDATALAATQAELSALAVKFNALNAQTLNAKATQFVDEAIKQGRVGVKPLRDHYIALHAKSAADAANVEMQITAMPRIDGNTVLPATPPVGGAVALTVEQKAVARLLGHAEADVLKTITDRAAQAA